MEPPMLKNARQSIARARQAAEALMVDTVRIEHPTGHMVTDRETGETYAVTQTVYEGPAKVQTAGGIAQQSSASATGETSNIGGVVPVWSLYLHLPVSVTDVQPGDIAELTYSQFWEDRGRKFRLINLQSEKTFATARRWNVSEIPQEASS